MYVQLSTLFLVAQENTHGGPIILMWITHMKDDTTKLCKFITVLLTSVDHYYINLTVVLTVLACQPTYIT